MDIGRIGIMVDEKDYVLSAFKRNFSAYKDKPIVIYGLGKNTNEIIKAFPDYQIIGLMDAVREGEIVYGKKVLSCEEVRDMKAAAIIIVARSANLRIIYRRIAHFCRQNHIPVFDINGIEQGIKINPDINLIEQYIDVTMEKWYRMIDSADVVSFDIFDTVLMRDVLVPHDIFAIMEKLIAKDSHIKNFANERIKAELQLYEKKHPKLSDIYDLLQERLGINDIQKNTWMELEISLERKHLLTRKEIVSSLYYAKENKKDIYFTSDMYLTSDILQSILHEKGIEINRENIIVSCEYGASKCNGLFTVLKEKNPNKKIVHIGDNKEADYIFALQYGIDDCLLINSAYHMLEDSQAYKLLQYASDIHDRCLIGKFIAKYLNNPFLFSRTKGKIEITSEYDLGYYFIAPLIKCFISWMIQKANAYKIDKILLGSRDGYLIEKLLKKIENLNLGIKVPEFTYTYTSRSVCLLVGLNSEEDIKYAASLAFDGTIEELLQTRFRLDLSEIKSRNVEESDMEYILKHKDLIIQHAKEMRKKYNAYLRNIVNPEHKKYAFFDFVSSGTCQMGLATFKNWDILGLYFVRVYDEYKKNLSIESLYTPKCIYEKQDAIMDFYFFLENVLTSFEATLADFTPDGQPIFGKENRNESQMKSLFEIQKGVIEAFSNQCESIGLINENLELADYFLKLIGDDYAIISMDYFSDNPLVDEFCNRKFFFEN